MALELLLKVREIRRKRLLWEAVLLIARQFLGRQWFVADHKSTTVLEHLNGLDEGLA